MKYIIYTLFLVVVFGCASTPHEFKTAEECRMWFNTVVATDQNWQTYVECSYLPEVLW
jgi:hypothetical protein